jgi:(E)-4-hydroxy-3-methylbut-2-enyl-diphosphate synthase
MNRYGDTPEGMVQSALEFVRICEMHDYRELILSMKASNPVVVLQAYRLLAQRMAEAAMDYPMHLGVTEAGDGEDGRIKSAVGIGALLDDGIGDTVRVSLTEDPVREIPVARALVERYNRAGPQTPETSLEVAESRDPFSYERRASHEVSVGPHRIGGTNTVVVEVPLGASLADGDALRTELDAQAGVRVPEETRAEIVCVEVRSDDELETLERLRESVETVAPRVALSASIETRRLRQADDDSLRRWLGAAHRLHLRATTPDDAELLPLFEKLIGMAGRGEATILLEAGAEVAVHLAGLDARAPSRSLLLAMTPLVDASPLHTTRLLAATLAAEGLTTPIVLVDDPEHRGAEPLLEPSSSLGGLLCDGIGDAIQLRAGSATDSRRLAFSILQAARVRTTRTEFISCPSCGRTLFDLEQTTARIKQRTAHLKGLKIAVMGCIVNGPGEMADADFGYVGWGEDKIALFVGKELVARDIPTGEADERLVELIKQHGRWVDPAVPA